MPFSLLVNRQFNNNGIRITVSAFDQARAQTGSVVERVDRQGVWVSGQKVEMASLCDSGRGHALVDGCNITYISQEEKNALAAYFELPTEAIGCGFFNCQTIGDPKQGRHLFTPDWEYMLNPQWALALNQWLADPQGQTLPQPSIFPWRKHSQKRVLLPGLWRRAKFIPSNKTGGAIGEMQLLTIDGQAQAAFSIIGEQPHLLAFATGATKLYKKDQDNGETYDRKNLRDLFNAKRLGSEYCFSKKADSEGLGLGNFAGMSIKIYSRQRFLLQPSKLYHVKAVKGNCEIKFFCYSSPDFSNSSLIGETFLPLQCGFPASESISFAPVAAVSCG